MISQKMTRKGFTLVELIVVITILAILATIAFLSFQGYASDGRDAKRLSDINSIRDKVTLQNANGVSLLSLVGSAANAITPISIGGAAPGAAYNAGIPNYTALDIKTADFKDPLTGEYRVGVHTIGLGAFEVAASLENGGGTKSAKVVGNYSPRTNIAAATAGSSRNATAASVTFSTATAGVVTIASGDMGKYRVGDTLTAFASCVAPKISSISKDGTKLTIGATSGCTPLNTATAVATDALYITAAETAGLTARLMPTAVPATAVTNDGADLPY